MFDHSAAFPSRTGFVRESSVSYAGTRGAALSAREVEAQLLAALKRVEAAQREAVSWFGEILDRRLYRRFGCSSIQQYARERLGFSSGRTSEFLKLWEALRKLPRLKEAVESGKVGWTKACQVIKVATPETEAVWVEDARSLNRPSLRRKVDAVRGAAKRRRRSSGQGEMSLTGAAEGAGGAMDRPAGGASDGDGAGSAGGGLELGRQRRDAGGIAAGVDVTSQHAPDEPVCEVPVGMSLTFTPEQYARYEALVETARRAGARGSREELFLAGLEALAGAAQAEAAPANSRGSDPHYQVVIQACGTCGKAATPTSRGELAVNATTLAAALCDARVRRPGKQNRATIPPSTRREVLARDGYRCTSAGCRNAHFLHVHHVVPRSAGGSNDPDNLVTLCGSCHRLVHEMEQRAGERRAAGGMLQPAEAVTRVTTVTPRAIPRPAGSARAPGRRGPR